MIKISYPGTNNFSTFVYDGLSRNVSIVETTAGSVTSTKQFVWSGSSRKEERDGSGGLTKKFFARGQMNSTTKYFYNIDHLGSVREMADNSGALQAQYAFDPFGRVTKLSETIASDFGFSSYYFHSRSALNLTRTRSYSSSFGRFTSRDVIEEVGGLNLYSYVGNSPLTYVDPDGLSRMYLRPAPDLIPPGTAAGVADEQEFIGQIIDQIQATGNKGGWCCLHNWENDKQECTDSNGRGTDAYTVCMWTKLDKLLRCLKDKGFDIKTAWTNATGNPPPALADQIRDKLEYWWAYFRHSER